MNSKISIFLLFIFIICGFATARVYAGSIEYVTAYGAVPNDGNDDTAAIQAAITANCPTPGPGETVNDKMAVSFVLIFPPGDYLITSPIDIPGNIKIKGPGRIVGNFRNKNDPLQPEAFKFIFKISPDVKTLIIDGMNFYNRNSVPLTRIKATVTTFIDEYEDPPSGTSATSRVHITNCTLVNCRIGVYYSHDNCDILIKNNHILSEWTPSDYKSWLRTRTTNPNTYTNNILDPRYFGVRIIDNVLDVACCSGHNRDLAKIGGQGQYTLVQGNLFKNSNPESQAEVDMFTGGYQIRFISNQLINASLKVHTGGNLENLPEHHIGEVKYVLVNDNQFIFEQGSAQNWGIVFRTIFGIISNNIIKRNGAENDHNFTGLVISGLKDAPNEFDGTSTPGALIVSDNLFDMRYEPGSGPQVGCVIKDTILYPMFSSNMVIGGDEMNIEGFTYIDP